MNHLKKPKIQPFPVKVYLILELPKHGNWPIKSFLHPTVSRGHNVTTVRYRMEQDIPLPDLGDNLEEVTIAVDNTDGTVPFVSQVEHCNG